MPKTYWLEVASKAFSGRVNVDGDRVQTYLAITENAAVETIQRLLRQGLDVEAVVEQYKRQENW